MIRAIFNGYWRSGTTLSWNIARESNPELLVFYEPFNRKLPVYLLRYGPKGVSPLHGIALWNDYYKSGIVEEVGIFHSNLDSVFPERWLDAKLYLQLFHNLPEDCVLKTNRAHFILDRIKKEFSARVVHIVRNPIDVYNSIIKYRSINKKISIIEKMAHLSYRIFRREFFFETAPCFMWIRKHFGYPSVWDYKFKITHSRDLLGKFAVCWTVSNYFALKAAGDCFFKYEDLLMYPDRVRKKVEDCTGIKFNTDKMDIKIAEKRYNKKVHNKFLTKIEEYGLIREFEFVESRLRYFKEEI